MDNKDNSSFLKGYNMMDELVSAIDDLILSLKESGKYDTAHHFLTVKDKLLTTENNAKLKVVLKRLMSSGSISQYANFNYRQDQLFDKICDTAEYYYKNIHASKLSEKLFDLIE